MTMTTQQAALPAPANRVLSTIGNALGAVVDSLRARWHAHRTRAALEALDPRTLRDIGIDFSDVLVLTTHGTDAIFATRKRVIHRLDRR
jgi:uncharacterized protein YjiS (DUF1127 family)